MKLQTITKKFIILLLITFILAIFSIVNNNSFMRTEKEQLLFPELNKKLNDISNISIKSNTQQFNIKKVENNWLIPEKYNFTADIQEIKKFLMALSSSKIIETKELNNNVKNLGLSEESSIQVQLFDNKGSIIEDIKIGNNSQFINGTYIKINNKNYAYLISENIIIDDLPKNWLNNKLFNIEARDVKQVIINRKSEKIILEKENNEMKLLNIPNNKNIKSPYLLNLMSSLLENFIIDDILIIESLPKNKELFEVSFITNINQKISIIFYNFKNEKWAVINTKLFNNEIENILNKFAFKLPEYKFLEFNKTMNDFLELRK